MLVQDVEVRRSVCDNQLGVIVGISCSANPTFAVVESQAKVVVTLIPISTRVPRLLFGPFIAVAMLPPVKLTLGIGWVIVIGFLKAMVSPFYDAEVHFITLIRA